MWPMAVDKRYKMKLLTEDNLTHIMNCLNQLDEPYTDPHIFIPPTESYLHTILSGYGKIVGVYHEGVLIAFASLVFPGRGNHNLGRLLNFQENELTKVLQLEHSFVVPKYRGQGIVNQMWHFLISPIQQHYNYMLSTISPKNLASLTAAFKRQQKIVKLMEIYETTRFLMARELHKQEKLYEKSICLSVDNYNEIRMLLNDSYIGWGFGHDKNSLLFARWG